ncbi:FAD-binding oxidoreductase [Nocardiopsis ansamitocini]|uniref:FAD-linked oxidase n=1 Tax=Nocardiopsis ansamitocini TaxID=1670832 RepID=A0A9W6P390_9ACTN|nr:FAD-linked oxidase C-terminal domain-containing protein [Nocardiopsis ansamitocini]GLU46318.1 FAD-linked oxidase [Nocardiopsis ansamitocini]
MTTHVHSTLLDRLRAGLPDTVLSSDPDVLAGHREDAAPLSPVGVPAALVRAGELGHVRHVLGVAQELGVPVVPQGARTGLSGGANAVDGCVLLSTERMNTIERIDPVEQIAVVRPGVRNADLSRAVRAEGLYYPPDPGSWETSTIGGNVATNAGGMCCVKYGVTADFVRGLEAVLPGGEVVRTGRSTAKGVAGYDLTRLLCGSEGTLAVITEVTLALVPEPETALTAVATFGSVQDAARAVAGVMAAGHRPSLLELLDAPTIRAVNAHRPMGLPEEAAAMLLVQSDRGPLASGDIAAYAKVFGGHGAQEVATADDAAESDMLLEARRLLLPALGDLGSVLVDDVCVPRGRMAELVEGVAALGATSGLVTACSGHAGDGNMHPCVIFDAADPGQVERAREVFAAIMDLGLALGGTITGEHGVGLLKRPWLATELGPVAMRLHREVKRVFDPKGILNPGKVLG